MHRTLVCFYFLLLLLLPYKFLCQRQGYTTIMDSNEDDQDKMVVDTSRFGIMSAYLPQKQRLEPRVVHITRPGSLTPKRAMQGSRFALSLDVPTTILSVLIDMAKEQDMRAKAAANAELMARIGKRK